MSTEQKIIKHKIGLLRLAEELGNVSRACKVMGYSGDTFYRYQQAVEEGGFEALVETSRRKPNLRNRIASEIEEAVVVGASSAEGRHYPRIGRPNSRGAPQKSSMNPAASQLQRLHFRMS